MAKSASAKKPATAAALTAKARRKRIAVAKKRIVGIEKRKNKLAKEMLKARGLLRDAEKKTKKPKKSKDTKKPKKSR